MQRVNGNIPAQYRALSRALHYMHTGGNSNATSLRCAIVQRKFY